MKLLKGVFVITVIFFAISAISPIFIPFATGENGMMNGFGYATGYMFWAGLILGIVSYIILSVIWRKKHKKNNEGRQNKMPTALRFFRNPLARLVDIMFLMGIMGVVYCKLDSTVSAGVTVFFLVILLTGSYGHFLANGDIYQYIRTSKKC